MDTTPSIFAAGRNKIHIKKRNNFLSFLFFKIRCGGLSSQAGATHVDTTPSIFAAGRNKIHIKKRNNFTSFLFFKIRCRQRAIFPGGGPPSIFAEMSLYDRVRDGNGWFPHSWSPTNLVTCA